MKDYTNYDYQALVDRMTDILKDKPGWGDAYQSSTGQTLIQLMADVTDHLHYMLERRTQESFLDTARLRTSIIARASELGYRFLRARGHDGYLTLSIIDDNDDPRPVEGEVVIDALRPISFEGRTFFTTEAVSIPEGSTSVLVPVKEGVIDTTTYDLTLLEEAIFLPYEDIEEDVLVVYDTTDEYLDVRKQADVNKRAISFLAADQKYYDIKYGVEGMRIVFGDNEFGKAPEGILTVSKSTVDTTQEAILSLDNVFTFDDALFDFQTPSIEYKYTLVNTTAIAGGSPAEDNDSIVANATAYHRSNGRAVTNDDYAFWMKQAGIGNIVDAKCFGEEEFDSLVYNANNVYITYATSTGTALTTQERQDYLDYFENVKTSQAHVVLNQAKNIMLRLIADVVKNKNVPISNAQAYNTLYNFMINYLQIKEGSIGGSFQLSDMINAMYDLKYTRAGVSYPLVDYVKLSSDVVVPFTFPDKTNEAFVEIDPTYVPVDGDEFVLNLENLVCLTTVSASDNFQDILLEMRDVVREVTPFDAVVQLSGVALDSFGNPIPIEINPKIGYNLLIGVDTPYFSKDELVAPAVVGSAVVTPVSTSPELEINHYYYSSVAGRRPYIPLRVGTIIDFTAPTDTDVDVYVRTAAKDASTESFVMTIPAGDNYLETFTEDHVVIFSYQNDSSEDVIANIKYPSFVGVKYGLRIRALDNFGLFSIVTTSGDLATYISVDYRIKLPVPDFFDSKTDSAVLAGSMRIAATDGTILLTEDGEGSFLNPDGSLVDSGEIGYSSGLITLPKTLPPTTPTGKYLLIYDQNRFENLSVGSSDVIKLIAPPPSLDSTAFSLSSIIVN